MSAEAKTGDIIRDIAILDLLPPGSVIREASGAVGEFLGGGWAFTDSPGVRAPVLPVHVLQARPNWDLPYESGYQPSTTWIQP